MLHVVFYLLKHLNSACGLYNVFAVKRRNGDFRESESSVVRGLMKVKGSGTPQSLVIEIHGFTFQEKGTTIQKPIYFL